MRSTPRTGLLVVALRHDDDELVAGIPGDDIALAGVFLEHLGEALEGEVAEAVAARVVDLLEVVEVEDGEREGRVVALGGVQLALEHLAQRPPIRNTGQAVGVGQALRLFEQPARLFIEPGVLNGDRGLRSKVEQSPGADSRVISSPGGSSA